MNVLPLPACFCVLPIVLGAAAAAQQPLPIAPALVPPPPFAPVEGDLRATILSALRAFSNEPTWTELLTKPPMGALLDALVPLPHEMPGPGERQVRRVLHDRRDQVADLWRDEPQARLRRAPAFALCDLDWVHRCAEGDEAEQRDVLAVAAWLSPESLEDAMRNGDDGARAAAERLARAAAEGWRRRGQRFREALAGTQWNLDLHLLLNVARDQLSAFAVVDGLRSPQRQVRARAMLALRRLRSLPIPTGLRAELSTEPIEPLRNLVSVMSAEHRGLQDAEVDAVLGTIRESGPLPWDRLCSVGSVSKENRELLVHALLEDPGAVHFDQDLLRRDSSLYSQLFPVLRLPRPVAQVAVAAAMGPDEFALVLGRLAAAAPAQRTTLLAGLYQAYWPDPGRAEQCARGVGPLIEDQDDDVAAFAGAFAGRLLEDGRFPGLVRRLGDRALAALAAGGELAFELRDPGFGPGMPSILGPATPAARWVLLGARAMDGRLLQPLIDRLPAPADTWRGDGRTWFTCECLSLLVPAMDAATARGVHGKILPLLDRSGPWIGGPQHRLWARLLAVVPDDLLDSYAKSTDVRHLRGILLDLDEWMAPARVRLVWPERDPPALTSAWSVGGASREQAIADVSAWWQDRPGRVLHLVALRSLPKDLAAAALPDPIPLDLPQLALLLPDAAAEAPRWGAAIARRLLGAAATRAQELDLLPAFAASESMAVARAAATRAHALGAAGAPIATRVVDRWAAGDAQAAAAAASLALELGTPPSDLRASTDRLQRDALFPILAACLLVRFGGLAIRDVPAADRVGVAVGCGAEFDTATWREALGGSASRALAAVLGGPDLGRHASPANALAVLALAAELPRWSVFTERAVIHRTLDADAHVRLAAYRALHSRDSLAWACAWIVYEAEFDPDPAVRAFAASLPARQR